MFGHDHEPIRKGQFLMSPWNIHEARKHRSMRCSFVSICAVIIFLELLVILWLLHR